MTRRLLFILAVIILIAVGATFALRQRESPPSPVATSGHESHQTAAADATPRAAITVDTRRQQLIGVRTVRVVRSDMAAEIRAAGTIAFDETRQAEINTRIDGWIRELYADYTGRPVRRGEALFTLYSPDLIAEQNEYLLALRGRATAGEGGLSEYSERLADAARERLLRLEMTPEEIDELARTGRPLETVTFRSPVNGVIVEKTALRGMRVMAGQMLFRIAGVSTVWAEAEVYETDLPNVRLGAHATVSLQGFPDRTFTGRVSYIYPTVTAETRTVRIRVVLPNPDGLLKPNMLATVTLHAPPSNVLIVPANALVDTGTQQLVFMAEGDGRFSPREVRIGRRTGDDVEVLAGVKEGDEIASAATFFLDSESQLRGALQNYEPTATRPSGGVMSTVDIAFRTEPATPHAGDNTFVVTVKDDKGQPVTDADVSIVLFMAPMPSMNMPAARSDAKLLAVGGGLYRGTGEVMFPGRWEATVNVSRGGRSLGARQFAVVAQ